MPKYIIEREIPGAGDMSREQLRAIAETSCGVLRDLNNSEYHWITSFVTGNKIYCVHVAPNEEVVREHARRGGFPADRIEQVSTQIDATTAERVAAAA
jgi:hypothetical protein